MLQFDNAQKSFSKDGIPVMHISQFQALAMGIDPISLGFDTHHVSAHSFLRKAEGGLNMEARGHEDGPGPGVRAEDSRVLLQLVLLRGRGPRGHDQAPVSYRT